MNSIEELGQANRPRYTAGQKKGHYESYFLRANHPRRKLAFWILYTIFSPNKNPQDATGELWAVYFDGEKGENVSLKKEFPLRDCRFKLNEEGLNLNVGGAILLNDSSRGDVKENEVRLNWNLNYSGGQSPVYGLAPEYYDSSFPKAKFLVSQPLALFSGEFHINGEKIEILDWPGSQNHNWGSRHTDRYAWGQVAGFDNAPDTFLELGTAQVRLGPFWTPRLTPIALRHKGQDYNLNKLWGAWGRASYDFYEWNFRGKGAHGLELKGRIYAQESDFVRLEYFNPPGGSKFCYNSKIAACELELVLPGESRRQKLQSANRCAFEILSDS